ncbi:MAG: RNA polymerase sigma factor [Bacillota bacterium]
MHNDDSTLIERSWSDPVAFAGIFDRHFVTIHRYLARRVGTDLADDLASEVFTVAFSRRVSYDLTRPSALPWLYGIAVNVLRAGLRQQQRHQHTELDPDAPIANATESLEDRSVASLDARRTLRSLRPAWDGLSDDDTTTLLLYAWEDLSYEDIAIVLSVPVGTVRSRLNRVRRKLREPNAAHPARTGRTATTSWKEMDQ